MPANSQVPCVKQVKWKNVIHDSRFLANFAKKVTSPMNLSNHCNNTV
jgi:hypothetical protein